MQHHFIKKYITKMPKNTLVTYLLSIIILFVMQSASAVEEHAKLWTSYEISGGIFNGSKIQFYLQPQLRFIDNQ
ncbi:MAG TPA: hypothetical protein PLD88_12965, partial [Candidatus Berkiella sp.]|nr:hypothetical protein [Candidatus Berkiella sp.]